MLISLQRVNQLLPFFCQLLSLDSPHFVPNRPTLWLLITLGNQRTPALAWTATPTKDGALVQHPGVKK